MEDMQIVDLYWQRDEAAIQETEFKYGPFCRGLAYNILSSHEDAEECVNDTWRKAWDSMPQERPSLLRAWLGKVVRNLALDLWRRKHAQKRYNGLDVMLSELEDCVPASENVESSIDAKELSRLISLWLKKLPEADRVLFVRRYWNGEALNTLAAAQGIPAAKLAQKMYGLRQNLRKELEKEGFSI